MVRMIDPFWYKQKVSSSSLGPASDMDDMGCFLSRMMIIEDEDEDEDEEDDDNR